MERNRPPSSPIPIPSLTPTSTPIATQTPIHILVPTEQNLTVIIVTSVGSFAALILVAFLIQSIIMYSRARRRQPVRNILYVAEQQISASPSVVHVQRTEGRVSHSPTKVRDAGPVRVENPVPAHAHAHAQAI